MTRHYSHIVVLCTLGFVVLAGMPVSAEIDVGGTAGFDLTAYGFTGSFHDTTTTYYTNRSMSNHFADVNLAGPLVSNDFASFFLKGRLTGTFSQSSTETGSHNFYLSPDLTSYYGSAVLFPARRYSLQLYLGQQLDRQLEYESKNRTETTVLQPSLSVVRRYRRESSQGGAVLSASLARNVSLSAQISRLETESLREYDFDEDRDIHTEIIAYPPDPFVDVHSVEIINTLPDASVRILFDGIDTTLLPNAVAILVVDSGLQHVLLVPLTRYNQYEFSTRVEGDMFWKIEYQEPLSPRDQKAEETSARVQLGAGKRGGSMLGAYYEYSDRFDPFTGQTTLRNMASNQVEYPLSNSDRLKLETSYVSNESTRGGVVTQSNQVLSHETTLEHASRRGFSAMLQHEFNQAKTAAGGIMLQTNLNRVRSRASLPFRRLKYRIDLECNVSLQSDDIGVKTDQYVAGLSNRMELVFLGFRWQPMNNSNLTVRNRVQQDGSSNSTKILETTTGLDGFSLRTSWLGDVSVKTSYGYRRQSDELGSEIKSLYGFDLLLSRSVVSGIRLDLIAIQKWETFGGTTPQPGPNEDQRTPTRPTDHKTTYRADLKLDPSPGLSLGLNYSLVNERLSRIGQYGLSAAATLPVLHLPVTSSFSTTEREIGDLPKQKIVHLQTELKYRFRQIELRLEHTYSKEELVTQTFTYFELIGRIVRNFGS